MSLTKILTFTILASLFLNQGEADQPPIKLQIVSRGLPVTLVADTGGSGSLLLERSADLTTWVPTLSVFSKLRSSRLIDRSTADGLASPRFYRAVGPAPSPDLFLENWRSRNFHKYTYRFQRNCFCNYGELSGTVTVIDGKVVGVTDARGNGAAITNPELSQFKSIEELFAIVMEGIARADYIAVEFDAALQFPSYIDLDYYFLAADDEIQYQASDVQPIP